MIVVTLGLIFLHILVTKDLIHVVWVPRATFNIFPLNQVASTAGVHICACTRDQRCMCTFVMGVMLKWLHIWMLE